MAWDELFTAPDVRGRGVARRLIEAVAWATTRGRAPRHTRETDATTRAGVSSFRAR